MLWWEKTHTKCTRAALGKQGSPQNCALEPTRATRERRCENYTDRITQKVLAITEIGRVRIIEGSVYNRCVNWVNRKGLSLIVFPREKRDYFGSIAQCKKGLTCPDRGEGRARQRRGTTQILSVTHIQIACHSNT